MAIIVDPQFAAFCNQESPTHFAKLEKKLLAEGCQDKLVLWKETGILLDGHTRLAICEKHGLGHAVRSISLSSRAEALQWIFDNQDARRNWTVGARAMAAAELKKELAKDAAKRQKATQTVPGEKVGSNVGARLAPTLEDRGKATDKAAEAMSVSPRTVARATTVLEQGTPELQEAVRKGQVSVSKAAQMATSPPSPEPVSGAKDSVGTPLPDSKTVRAAFARLGEVKGLQREVSKLKGKILAAAARPKDPIFANLDVSAVKAERRPAPPARARGGCPNSCIARHRRSLKIFDSPNPIR
jgi:hypothetical protein